MRLFSDRPWWRIMGTLLALGLAASLTRAADPAPPQQPTPTTPVKEIIVVCKTHFDIGFTHRVKDIVQYYRTGMIDHALGIMDKSKDLPPKEQFAWTAPGWVMAQVLADWPGQTPERRAHLEAAFRSGKFITHAAPFTIEGDNMDPESFARGQVYSSSISRKYGLPLPAAAKMTDVPSQTGALATALAHGGVRFLHIGCNSACSCPSPSPRSTTPSGPRSAWSAWSRRWRATPWLWRSAPAIKFPVPRSSNWPTRPASSSPSAPTMPTKTACAFRIIACRWSRSAG